MKKNKILAVSYAFILSLHTYAQTQLSDSIQNERIAKVCELWGHLKYFHPYLPDTSINWEGAFIDNINGVICATNKNEYAQSVQKMLDRLNDPVTMVVTHTPVYNDIKDTLTYPSIEFIEDSILLIRINNYIQLEDYAYCISKFSSLKSTLPLTNKVIFDLRNPIEIVNSEGYLSYYFQFIEKHLSDEEQFYPGVKARLHEGFANETERGSPWFYSGYYVKGEKRIIPAPNSTDKKIVFILNKHSEIPASLIALYYAGKAIIISPDILTDASLVNTTTFTLEDGLDVSLRLNMLAVEKSSKIYYHKISKNLTTEEITKEAIRILNGEKINSEFLSINKNDIKKDDIKPASDTWNSNYPDLAHRLLAAAKIWVVIDYFFAYKELMDDDWNEVLRKHIPLFASASDSIQYNLAVAKMYSHIQDGHGVIFSNVLSNYFGTATPPVKIRFIENQPVVTNVLPDSIYKVQGIEKGDIIIEINGEDVESKITKYDHYIASSNSSALYRYISHLLLNGKDSTMVSLKIKKRNNEIETIELSRYNNFSKHIKDLGDDRNETPIIKLLNRNIGYVDLTRLTTEMTDSVFIVLNNTKAIIFDMRGSPIGDTWAVAAHLTNRKNVYAAVFKGYTPMQMNVGDYILDNFSVFKQPIPPPLLPYYNGITVMLIDERTQSASEHTGLFFKAANNTIFIGSQTAGANGDVTGFKIPGNISLFFSGYDVQYIDGTQLQKIGLVPDIEVKPTIEGIREGRDEILEVAIEYLEETLKE